MSATFCPSCSTEHQPDTDPCGQSTLVGRTLQNGIRILEKFASTREGPLYRAEYPTGLEVALLVLGTESGDHESFVDSGPRPDQHPRFRQAAQIRHMNVAAVHEIGEIPEGPRYVVLERLAGESLSEILARRGALPPDEAMDLFLQAAAGLGAAHEVGLVHANLSPDTVLITQTADGPLVKVIGFALASSLPPALKKPIDSEVGVEYASPERLAGYIPDERSDVFSLGAVLHHLLAGAPPGFGSEGFVSEIMRATVAKAVLPIPEHRFQTMSQFVGAVKRAAAVATSPKAAVATGPKRVRTRRPLLLAAGGSVALVAGGLWLLASLQGQGHGADGLAQEPDTRTPAGGVPEEGIETGSTLRASRGEGRRETLGASRGILPGPAASEDPGEPAHAGSTPGDPSGSPAQVPAQTESSAATDAIKARQEKLASLPATAAAATAKLVEDRHRGRAEAAGRAVNGDGQIQTTQPSSASGEDSAGGNSAPDSSAMPTSSPASPSPTLEERAQVDLPIGLDEVSRHLGEPAHAIEGMSPLFMGLARGRFPEGADTTIPLVRGVYLDPNGALILLDQQRIRSEPHAPTAREIRWPIGDIMLYLHGDSRPAMLRNLVKRVR